MNLGRHGVAVGLVAALTLAGFGRAHAEGARPAARRIWLEVRPRASSTTLAAFTSNVRLACDAMGGGCAVADAEEDATERATMFCDAGGPWTVGLTTLGNGEALVVALAGDREERLRRAAMWIADARLESEAVASPAPIAGDARDESTAPSSAFAPYPFPFAVLRDAPPRKPARAPARLGVAIASFTGFGSSVSEYGLDLQVALPLWRSFYWGPFASYQVMNNTGLPFASTDAGGATLGHGAVGGVTIGWGAPFDDQWFGFSFTLGGGANWGTGEWSGTSGTQRCDLGASSCIAGLPPVSQGRGATGLFRSGFGIQVPFKHWPVRPTLSTATSFTSQLGTFAVMQTLDVGLVWQAL